MVDKLNNKENKEMIDGNMKWTLKPTWSCFGPLMRKMEQNVTEGQALWMCLVAHPYLMGPAKVIKPAKQLGEDPERLS